MLPDGDRIGAEFMARKEGNGWLAGWVRNGAEMPFRTNT